MCVHKRFVFFALSLQDNGIVCWKQNPRLRPNTHRTSSFMARAVLKTFTARVEDSGRPVFAKAPLCVFFFLSKQLFETLCTILVTFSDRLTHIIYIGRRPLVRRRPRACAPVPLFPFSKMTGIICYVDVCLNWFVCMYITWKYVVLHFDCRCREGIDSIDI